MFDGVITFIFWRIVPMKSSFSILAVCLCRSLTVGATLQDLVLGIQRLNSDVIELRNKVESSISRRCDSIAGCYKSSFDECRSEYTSLQQCPSLELLGYAIPECGSGMKCNGLFDTTITTVRLPSNLATGVDGNPTNAEVIEAVCYTRSAEKWMVKKYNEDKQLWKSLNVSSPRMYFGSSTGVFRVFPATHSRECGTYDPRVRPWYQALVPSTTSNSVKARNVVIVMDTSRSMSATLNKNTNVTMLSFMKEAVISTVKALSETSHVSVIRFGESPEMIGRPSTDPLLWEKATSENKERIITQIETIQVNGRSDVVQGLEFTFDLIRNSLNQSNVQDTQACELENIALLLFSDGDFNSGISYDEIVNAYSSYVEEVESLGDYHLATFLYSIGNTDPNQVMKQISCAVDGYWTPVSSISTPGKIISGYQALFSLPLSTSAFYNYTSWSKPYKFTSTNKLGYTVSALVYNRDVEPPRFMGAVGMDISADAAMNLYGGTMEETEMAMDEILSNIKETEFSATCEQQRINLTYCEIQSVRQLAGGNEAVCFPPVEVTDQNATGNLFNYEYGLDVFAKSGAISNLNLQNCSKAFIPLCPGYDEYPDELWANVNFQDKAFNERVCCEVGTNNVTDQCPGLEKEEKAISNAAIFWLVFASLAVVELFGCYFCFYYRKTRST